MECVRTNTTDKLEQQCQGVLASVRIDHSMCVQQIRIVGFEIHSEDESEEQQCQTEWSFGKGHVSCELCDTTHNESIPI